MIARIDAWDKSYRETDWDGSLFPEEYDKDQDGIIYYVYMDENQEVIMDKEEFDHFMNEYIEEAAVIEIPFQTYLIENIEQVGK